MTLKNCEKLMKHYNSLIENPDLAFPSNAKVKPQGRESVIKEAKNHLNDMKENLEIRQYVKDNPGIRLDKATILRKLRVPQEAIEKEVVEKTKKSK